MNKKYHAEIWKNGPVSTEVWRLAAEHMRKETGAQRWDNTSKEGQRKCIIALLWNTGDLFLKRAKFNLEKQGIKP